MAHTSWTAKTIVLGKPARAQSTKPHPARAAMGVRHWSPQAAEMAGAFPQAQICGKPGT